MNTNEPNEDEPTPDAEALSRITSVKRLEPSEHLAGSREAFLALGEVIEQAIGDFDWQKLASQLNTEIALERTVTRLSATDSIMPNEVRGSRQMWSWLSVSTAIVLLVSLTLGLLFDPSVGQFQLSHRRPPKVSDKELIHDAPVIDSWAQSPTASEVNSLWNDEIDVELAATRRALKQGRDPWVGDEPALSEVFAQIGNLTAGLQFDPF